MIAEEGALLERARGGDSVAFAALIHPMHRELERHCRRILRSDADAEDAAQEALLRAWRRLDGFEGRSPLRGWLFRIATNVCLNVLATRARRPVIATWSLDEEEHAASPQPAHHAPEHAWEQRENVEEALATAVQVLAPGQRTALIMREVLGYSAADAATALGTTEASVNSALQRARAGMEANLDGRESERGSARPSADDLVRAYAGAIERGELELLAGVLATAPAHGERHWRFAPDPVF